MFEYVDARQCNSYAAIGVLNADERRYLRELAAQVVEIGHLPVQTEKIRLWKAHN